jgi:hypothetical protein
MFSTYLCRGLPSGLFPSGFPTNILNAFLFAPFILNVLPFSSSLTYHSNWWRVQIMKLLIMQFTPTSCHFISLQFKYSLQQPVLKHRGPMSLP